MYYDIIVESMVENCLTAIVYVNGDFIQEKIIDKDGNEEIGNVSKDMVEKIIKNVDYIPFLEAIYDMIEMTREFEKRTKRTNK